MSTVKEKFKRIAGLENVLGAIDGSYIEIPATSVIFIDLSFVFCYLSLINRNLCLL